MAQAIFILNNGRLSSLSRAMWAYKICRKGVKFSKSRALYIIEIRSQNAMNGETKDRTVLFIALQRKAL
jgi:hypothetical protein